MAQRDMTKARLATVWDDAYCTSAASTNSTTKQAHVIGLARAEDLLDTRTAPFDLEATLADIARVHDPAFVAAVLTGRPVDLAESQGFRWSPAFAESVARIWSGQHAAALLALETGRFVFHPVSGAHHAGLRRGSAFCTFNFLAGIAFRLMRERRAWTVGIVDLDAHTGNGTIDFAVDDPRLACFDISGARWLDTLPLPPWVEHRVARNATQYTESLSHLPAWLDEHEPDLVFYQAGVDCWERDAVGGIAGVTARFLAERDETVLLELAARGIPAVINLGGGYESESPALHVQTARIARGIVAQG